MIPERLTLKELLKQSISQYGQLPFAAFVGEKGYSYTQYALRIAAVQRFFAAKGVTKGDRIAILGENSPEWGICYLAVTTYGAVAVPLLTDFQSSEISSILEHAQIQGICVSQRLEAKASQALQESKPNSPADSTGKSRNEGFWRLRIDDLSEIDGQGSLVYSLYNEAEEDASADKEIEFPRTVQEEDPAAIIYTSGTTGAPKGVSLTHRNITHNVVSTSYIPVKLRPGDRLLSILPLAHTYECTIGFLAPLLLGCCVYYLHSLPAPTVLMPALKSVQPHVILSVPLLMEKLYRKMVLPKLEGSAALRLLHRFPPGRRLMHLMVGYKLRRIFGGKLKYFIVGGASLSPEVERFLHEACFPLAKGYGLTETSPLIAGCTPAYDRLYSVGTPLQGISVSIDTPDPEQQPGEILVKGPSVTPGYYREQERTQKAFDREEWFHTGDLGTMDRDGYLYINGRLKNLIVGPSGENIYPEEIETLLYEDEAVLEALVIEQQGRVIALVHPDYKLLKEKKREQVDEFLQQLRKTVNSRLPAFSRLAELQEQKEAFEKTPTNKIKRYIYTSASEET